MTQQKTKTILIIDDEPILRRALQRWLSTQQWEIWEAQNGQEAIQLIEQQSYEYFDRIILDWLMPTMSGADFLKYAQKQRWNLKKITILSAVDPAELSNWSLLVKQVFHKPIEDMLTFITHITTES